MLLIQEKHPNASITVIREKENRITYRCNYCGKEKTNSRRNLLRNKYLCDKCFDNQKEKPLTQLKVEENSKKEGALKLIEWRGVRERAVFLCPNCREKVLRFPANYNRNPFFCEKCMVTKGHEPKTLQEAQKNLDDLFGPNYFEILEYGANGRKSTIKHLECGLIFKKSLNNFKQSRGCPKCDKKKSLLEKIFEEFLEENNFSYQFQKRFLDLPRFSFDFKIDKKDGSFVLVEIQGQQHYHEVEIFNDSLEENQRRDQIKREYCVANNIPLIEIPYWEINNIEKFFPLERFNDYLERE